MMMIRRKSEGRSQLFLNSFSSAVRGTLRIVGTFLGVLLLTLLPLYADDTLPVADYDEGIVALQYLEWLLENRITNYGAQGSLLNAWEETQWRVAENSDGAFWEPLGPTPLGSGSARVSGRTNAVAIDPKDPNVIYIGAALGGVWKTTNGGQSWTPMTDDQPSLAMGAIAIDPSDTNIVYAGTGEQNFAQDAYYGLGVLRTMDGGRTWTRLGESVFVIPAGGGAAISRILVDPDAPETVYVSSTYGLFKSTDSGGTWSLRLGSRGGAPVTDLAMDPTNSTILYAALGMSTATTKGVYRSSDLGDTWERLNIGLTQAQIGRVNLAIAPSDPQTIYVSVHNPQTAGTPGIYRLKSTDGGDTWRRITDCSPLGACSQGYFNNVLVVHPTDPDIVYHGAVNLFRSTNGGQTWTSITAGLHPDYHALVFDQLGNLYIGSDGGVYRVDPDGTLSNLNTNLSITQFYAGVALHPFNANSVLAGAQDNGSTQYTGTLAWRRTCGGDGMFQAIEGPDGNPDRVWYCSAQGLRISKTMNNGTSYINTDSTALARGLDRTGAAFVAPFIIDPNNSSVLIAGTTSIWRTDDGTQSWTRNSGPLMAGQIRSLAFAAKDSDTTYYAGTSAGRVFRTTDTGASWISVSTGLPSNRVISQIRVSPYDSGTVYITVSGFGAGHVYRSTDAGMTWSNISGNLPNVPATALWVDFDQEVPAIYVGTDIGVFRSLDDGVQWERFSTGLPNVRVEDLVFNPETGILVASTHGRGMWKLNFGS